MKKKLLLSVLALFVFAICTVKVDARSTMFGIPFGNTSQTPEVIPTESDVIGAFITEVFDFSRVQFESTTEGTTINGSGTMRKIVLTDIKNQLKPGKIVNILKGTETFPTNQAEYKNVLGKWFIGYCLDNSKNYPLTGLLSGPMHIAGADSRVFLQDYANYAGRLTAYSTEGLSGIKGACTTNPSTQCDGELLASSILGFALENLIINNKDLFNAYGYVTVDEFTASATFTDANDNAVANYPDPDIASPNFIILKNLLLNSDFSAVFTITKISKNGTQSTISQQIPMNQETLGSTLFDRYNVLGIDKMGSGYDDAIWIIEHSYPTISLDKTFETVGITEPEKATVISDLATLQTHAATDAAFLAGVSMGLYENSIVSPDSLSDTQKQALLESYVYSTIQYAIWNVTDTYTGTNGEKLGGSIKNVTGLDKIYKYYVGQKGKHSGYASASTISTEVTVETTDKYTETDNGYKFGPFKASYTALETKPINLAFKETEDGVKFVNADGTVIDKVDNGGEYYIEVSKKAKVGSIEVNLTTDDVETFIPNTNRARIYTHVNGVFQNVITGGKVENKKLTASHVITVNAKTGVENVAVLLMVTLVAFSLGYLVLSYKNKPVELS